MNSVTISVECVNLINYRKTLVILLSHIYIHFFLWLWWEICKLTEKIGKCFFILFLFASSAMTLTRRTHFYCMFFEGPVSRYYGCKSKYTFSPNLYYKPFLFVLLGENLSHTEISIATGKDPFRANVWGTTTLHLVSSLNSYRRK